MIRAAVGFTAKTCAAAVLGWLPAALMLLMLGGCMKPEKYPLAAYTADPKAFQFWVIPW